MSEDVVVALVAVGFFAPLIAVAVRGRRYERPDRIRDAFDAGVRNGRSLALTSEPLSGSLQRRTSDLVCEMGEADACLVAKEILRRAEAHA
jgi:hypothetical protein